MMKIAEEVGEVIEHARKGLDGGAPSSKVKRPLVVVHVLEGCKGGVGTAVRNLIFGQSVDEGIGIIHLLADPDPTRMGDMLADVPAVTHYYKSSRNPRELRDVARDIQERLEALQPDIVFLHSTFPGLYGRLRVKGIKTTWATVYCAHGWAFTQQVSGMKRRAYQLVERLLANRADAIVSISHFEHKAAVRAGIRHSRHEIIPHGMPATEGIVHHEPRDEKEGIQLLFVGRFDRQKGVDLLFDAWKDPRLKDVHLWLIGDKTLECETELPVQDNVHSLGWVRNDQIDSYIKSFDAVIMPSRWEGFGLVALEAMRNERAVLASRIGGLQELIIDRVNGRLFDPEAREELIQLLSNLTHGELQQMGEMGGAVFRAGFEWENCYRRWNQLSQEALDAHSELAQLSV